MSAKPTVAFIGTGIMGGPMIRNLLAAGFPVKAHNRTRAKTRGLQSAGATVVDSPAAAAEGADFVLTCLPDSPDVQQVYLGEKGVMETIPVAAVSIDFSTISPAVARDLARMLAARTVAMLDAPVSGGDVGAKNATLSIMVGGPVEAFERALPLLSVLGKTITHCGPNGAGQQTKLCNQVLGAVNLAAVCEALLLAQRAGLDAEKMIAAVAGGAAGSWALSNLAPRILAGDFDPGFMIDLALKDLRLVFESASQAGVALPATALVQQFFTAAQAHGLGQGGTQAVYQEFARLARSS